MNENSPAPTAADTPVKSRSRGVWLFAGLLVAGCVAWAALHPSPGQVPAPATAGRPAVVAVTKVIRTNLALELVFDAEFRPFQDIELQSHVAGFVQQMNVDVGDRVKIGQLIAVIEIPEFKEELERAVAVKRRADEDVHRAEEEARRAELDIAKTDAGHKRASAAHAETRTSLDRLETVSRAQPGLVAQQDLDLARAREATAAAQVEEARATQASARAGVAVAKSAILALEHAALVADADIHRLQARFAFSKIAAPFEGVVTKRYADVGDFVRGGLVPSAPAVPLVRLVTVDKLRLVFPVSSSYVARVKIGQALEFTVPELSLTLSGIVARVAGEVDMATRSMEVQVDVLNPENTLIPGMSATVALTLDRRSQVLTVPIAAVARAGQPSIFVIAPDNTIAVRTVKLGLETAARVEIISGLQEGELVFVGSRTQVKPGQKVEPKLVEILTAE